jgi:hypothetical protein
MSNLQNAKTIFINFKTVAVKSCKLLANKSFLFNPFLISLLLLTGCISLDTNEFDVGSGEYKGVLLEQYREERERVMPLRNV